MQNEKTIFKRATALAMATAMAAGSATTAFAGQWKQDATGYWWDETAATRRMNGNGWMVMGTAFPRVIISAQTVTF